MREFQILFDHGEHSELLDPVFARYGRLGFPAAPAHRPWIFANFVQTVDGIVSLLGRDASGGDIAQSEEDRWLMDLLRAHADGVLLGLGTLKMETELARPRPRGPVFRIMDPTLRKLHQRLRNTRERNIFVTATGNLQLSDYCVFDPDAPVDVMIITSPAGAARLKQQMEDTHSHVKLIVSGTGESVDLDAAMRLLREQHGVQHLLCEGGPRLYGAMLKAGLIDEKFLTVAPIEVGQLVSLPDNSDGKLMRPTIAFEQGFSKQDAVRWTWLSCRRVGDHQFHRFRRLR
ncbi:MAG TPA: dihydrofolate reductase family protein [Terriglobales bacterium]